MLHRAHGKGLPVQEKPRIIYSADLDQAQDVLSTGYRERILAIADELCGIGETEYNWARYLKQKLARRRKLSRDLKKVADEYETFIADCRE